MGKFRDLTGQKFNRWTVLSRAPDRYDKRGSSIKYWLCECDCGTKKEVNQYRLTSGVSKSCGCLQREIVREIGKNSISPFKFEIGEIVKTNLGSITITDKVRVSKGSNKHKCKYYYYKCNVCGYESDEEHIVLETSLTKGHGCSICGGGSAVQRGINDISTTASWMLPYFKNINDAYVHSIGCRKLITFKCIHCGYEFEKILANAYNAGLHCPICEDGYSYPEKFMMSVLNQLNVSYKFQLTNKTFNWCGKYKYDFYLPDKNMIIETHGEQHYFNNGSFNITVDEQKQIDELKFNLATDNGINYIAVDCSYSNVGWIKNSINKTLGNIFDLSNIDWDICHSNALKNVAKDICDYYMENNKPSTIEISKIFPYHPSTILRYLKNGKELGWCDYNAEIAKKKSKHKSSMIKNIKAWFQDEYIGIFYGSSELIKYAKEHYDIQLRANSISETCNGKQQTTKGFKCEYV